MDTTHISYSLRLQLAGETVHIVGRRDRMQVCNYITLIMQACTLTCKWGGSFLQNVKLYLLTGEYLQIQSYTHTFVHKQLVTPSAQQLVKHNKFTL